MDRLTEDFRTAHLCTKCGQQGTVTWEPGRLDPVATSGNFYLRVKTHIKEPRVSMDIVCAKCGVAQRGELPVSTVAHAAPGPKVLR